MAGEDVKEPSEIGLALLEFEDIIGIGPQCHDKTVARRQNRVPSHTAGAMHFMPQPVKTTMLEADHPGAECVGKRTEVHTDMLSVEQR
ncbi:hypothetical protein UB46_33190 [Burkholderiaceae bacterium 16]|nr:hypothetical protein UB46_33190 [Burkholderiaceae bacterium 16]